MDKEITQILENFRSENAEVHKQVLEKLEQLWKERLCEFLVSLSQLLSTDDAPQDIRMWAGYLLKNSLDVKNAEKWELIDITSKRKIKRTLLNTLACTSSEIGDTAAKVIAKIASMEIPKNEWSEFPNCLLINMSKSVTLKKASLESLGYVFQEISHNDLAHDQVHSVLTAVLQAMRVTEEKNVRLAAAKTLCRALHLRQEYFEIKTNWDSIMNAVYGIAKDTDAGIRKVTFECIALIASTYYEFLEPYILYLFDLTTSAFEDKTENVSAQAVGFWQAICVEELRLTENSKPHQKFIENSYCVLVPELLKTLPRDKCSVAIGTLPMTLGACLGLVAKIVRDPIISLVMPYVQENLSKKDVASREAGVYVFVCILEGPSVENLSPMASIFIDWLLIATRDKDSHARDQMKAIAVWALSRIFELLHNPANGLSVITPDNSKRIMQFLLESIHDKPDVALKVCEAIYHLAHGYEGIKNDSSFLTPYLSNVVHLLRQTAGRIDKNDPALQSAAYETLNEIVRCSNISKTYEVINSLLMDVISDLDVILSSNDRESRDLQDKLCGVLQVIIRQLGSMEKTKELILIVAGKIMEVLLNVLNFRSEDEIEPYIHIEAMLAASALANVIGQEFKIHMKQFFKFMEIGLQSYDYQVCSISVGVVRDICRALGKNISAYSENILVLLFKILNNEDLHASMPLTFSCIGDIALLTGKDFEKHVSPAMVKLQLAHNVCAQINVDDKETVEYVTQLKRSIFEAYSGILPVLKNSKAQLMSSHVPQILKYMEVVIKDAHRDESLGKAAIALLGDVANAIGPNMSVFNLEMRS